jgi:hypothetical protein
MLQIEMLKDEGFEIGETAVVDFVDYLDDQRSSALM